MIMSSNINDDAFDDLIEFVSSRASTDIVYENLDYLMAGDREDYKTRLVNNMVNNIVNVYNFFYEDYYRGDSERACFDRAVEFIAETTAAKEALQSRSILNRLTSAEQRELSDLYDDSRQVLNAYNQYQNNYGRRGGRTGGTSARDISSGRGYQQDSRFGSGRYRRRENTRDSNSLFDESDNQPKAETGTSYRARALASRSASRHQETRNVPSRQERTRTQVQQTDPGFVTNVGEFMFYGRTKEQHVVPNYNPATQRLQAYVGEDNVLRFRVLEIENMDAETHKTVIDSMLTKHRNDEYVNAVDKRAVYKIDNYEVDAASVENDRVNDILAEWESQGKIEKGAKFNDLDSGMKRVLLNESAKRLNAAREAVESAQKAKLINEGTYEQSIRKMELVKVDIDPDTTSVAGIVDKFVAKYGGEISADTDRKKAYMFAYKKLSVLHRCEGVAERQNLLNLLTGFHKGDTTIQNITISLSDKKIPIGLFNRLNNACTYAANEWIRYIMDIPQLQLSNFIDDIGDLSSWFVKQVESGAITNDAINGLNKYVSERVGTILPNDTIEVYETLAERLGITDDAEKLSVIQSIYSEEVGNIIYLPLTSAEMGLNPNGSTGYNILQLKYNSLYASLFDTSRRFTPRDYIVTMEGEYFRVIGRVDDGIVLKSIRDY